MLRMAVPLSVATSAERVRLKLTISTVLLMMRVSTLVVKPTVLTIGFEPRIGLTTSRAAPGQ